MNEGKKQLNILFVARDDGGCGYYRCQQPAKFFTRAGLANSVSVLKLATPEQMINSDLVIMQEMGSKEASNMVAFMEKNRVPFMLEFDDYVHHISPRNIAGYTAWNPSTLYLYRAMELAKRASGLTVSTPQLAREYFPYNKFIYVVPNYLDKDLWTVPIMKRQDDKVRIGWAGGNAHSDDLGMVSKVIEQIVKEYNGKVVFETMGMTRQELVGAFAMPPTDENPCPSCGFEGELHHFPGESYESYPQVVASRGWDIAIAPVIDNAFGNAKSHLKLKEYAAIKCPAVASNISPYRDAQRDGAVVLLADTHEEWYEALKSLIDDPDKRDEMVKTNKLWVEQNWIQDKIHGMFGAYQEVITRAEKTMGDKASRLEALKKVQ